jgi:hypothetical protein
VKIVLIQLIAGMEFHQPVWRNTPYRLSADISRSVERLKGIGDAKNVVTFFVKGAGMEIDQVSLVITIHKITLPTVIPGNFLVTPGFEYSPDLRYIFMENSQIKVLMGAGLYPQQGIHSPPAVKDHLDPVLVEQLDDI